MNVALSCRQLKQANKARPDNKVKASKLCHCAGSGPSAITIAPLEITACADVELAQILDGCPRGATVTTPDINVPYTRTSKDSAYVPTNGRLLAIVVCAFDAQSILAESATTDRSVFHAFTCIRLRPLHGRSRGRNASLGSRIFESSVDERYGRARLLHFLYIVVPMLASKGEANRSSLCWTLHA
jgi:hypothetical protein